MLSQKAGKSKNVCLATKTPLRFLACRSVDFLQIIPSLFFRLDLQTWRKTPEPGSETRIRNVAALPEGTEVPAFGASGVIPFLVAAEAGTARTRAVRAVSASVRATREGLGMCAMYPR